MSKFIGEEGFYPRWAVSGGRWVLQKVRVQTGSMLTFYPPEADKYLVWVPPQRGLLGLRKVSLQDEISNSITELSRIPLKCDQCAWEGRGNLVGYAGQRSYHAVSCPVCHGWASLGPDLRGLDAEAILKRWEKLGKPTLEAPGAAPNIVSIAPISDLRHWLKTFEPMPNELAYVGQQLWPDFATFVVEARRFENRKESAEKSFKKAAKGTVLFATEGGIVFALDAATGQKRWAYKAGDSIVSTPVVASNTVYFGCWDNKLYALDVTTGELQWSYKTRGRINSTPAVMCGTVVFGSYDGRLYALDATSGKRKWTCETGGRILCSPVSTLSTVYFGSEDGLWYGVEMDKGNVRWSYSRDLDGSDDNELGYGCAGVANGLVYFISSNEKLVALDSATGEYRWTYFDEESPNKEYGLGGIQHACMRDGLILCNGIRVGLHLLNGTTGEVLWRRKGLYESGPSLGYQAVAADNVIYTTADKIMVAIDAETGRPFWRSDDIGDEASSLFMPAVEDRVLCIVRGRNLVALDTLTGTSRWTFDAGDEISTSPTISPLGNSTDDAVEDVSCVR